MKHFSTVLLASAVREVGWLSAAVVQRPTNVLVLVVMFVIVRWRGARAEDLPPLSPEPEPVIDIAAAPVVRGRGARVSRALSARSPSDQGKWRRLRRLVALERWGVWRKNSTPGRLRAVW